MKKRLLCMFLSIFMLVPLAFIFSACGEKTVSSLELEDEDGTYKDFFILYYSYGEIDGEEIMLRAYTARATYTDGTKERLLREDTEAEDLAGCYIRCYKQDESDELQLVPWFHDLMDAGYYKVEVGYRGRTATMIIYVSSIHENRDLYPYITIKGRLNHYQYATPFTNEDVQMNLSYDGDLVNEAIDTIYFIPKAQHDHLMAITTDNSQLKDFDYVMRQCDYIYRLQDLDTAPVGTYYLFCKTKTYGNYYGDGCSLFTEFIISSGFIRFDSSSLDINLTFDYNEHMFTDFAPVTSLAASSWGELYAGLDITIERKNEDDPYYYINNNPVYENNITDYGYFELANENESLDYNDHGRKVRLKFIPFDSNYICGSDDWADTTIIRRHLQAPFINHVPDFTVCHTNDPDNPKEIHTLTITNDYTDILDIGSDDTSQTDPGTYCRTYSRPQPSITCWTYKGLVIDENTVFDVDNMSYDKDTDKITITWEVKKQDLDGEPFCSHDLYTCILDGTDGYKMQLIFDPNTAAWSVYTPLSIDEVQFTIKKDNVDVTSSVLSNPALSYDYTSGDYSYTINGINYYADFTSTGDGEYEIIFTIPENNHYLKATVLTYTITIPYVENW